MIGQGKENRITIEHMQAIERIKGYCTEVTQEQWEELVRVADEVGIKVYGKDFSERYSFFALNYECTMLVGHTRAKGTLISFSDFFAELKVGDEWKPKAGEMGRIRKSRPIITRAEAEALLNKRVID